MCAQHALNMLLQGHYFTTDNLVTIARELDQRERAVLDNGSQQESQNFDDSGYFSIQVFIHSKYGTI
jgi:ataxin-3